MYQTFFFLGVRYAMQVLFYLCVGSRKGFAVFSDWVWLCFVCVTVLQLNLMRSLRQSIIDNTFKEFVCNFMVCQFPQKNY